MYNIHKKGIMHNMTTNSHPNWLAPNVLLKFHRKQIKLTQKDLAKLMDKKQHHISELENGKRNITIALAMRFGKIFNIDYRVFL